VTTQALNPVLIVNPNLEKRVGGILAELEAERDELIKMQEELERAPMDEEGTTFDRWLTWLARYRQFLAAYALLSPVVDKIWGNKRTYLDQVILFPVNLPAWVDRLLSKVTSKLPQIEMVNKAVKNVRQAAVLEGKTSFTTVDMVLLRGSDLVLLLNLANYVTTIFLHSIHRIKASLKAFFREDRVLATFDLTALATLTYLLLFRRSQIKAVAGDYEKRKQELMRRMVGIRADYYGTLGVLHDATHEQIRGAYRKIAKETRADVVGQDEEKIERFKAAVDAYKVLGNAAKRKEYDDKLKDIEELAKAFLRGTADSGLPQ
jgi:hypothetical protein